MVKCSKCGAERKLVGVMFPARLLCACELQVRPKCSECRAPALIVEFQKRVRGEEPALDSDDARFLCASHKPDGFNIPTAETKKGTKPHVDPEWSRATEASPPGAFSRLRVQCASCKNEHEMRQRVMFNGSRSECPKCGHHVTTPAWEGEAHAQ